MREDDECYVLGEYTPKRYIPAGVKLWEFSKTNNLINNFKREPEWKGRPDVWRYKEEAIDEIARSFSHALVGLSREMDILLFGRNVGVVFIPIAPSKTKDAPDYDSRLPDMLSKVVCPQTSWGLDDPWLNVQDLVMRRVSTTPARFRGAGERQNPSEIVAEHYLAVPTWIDIPIIAVVDDVLTEGAHYAAYRQMLSRRFPNARIIGLFIARSYRGDDHVPLENDDDDLPW